MNVWKGVALTLICLLLIVVAFNLFHKPSSSETSSSQNEQTKAYYAALEEQKQKYMQQIDKATAAIDYSVMVNELSLHNQERFQKILEHWEKQADRLDNLILGLENKVQKL